jgi:putative transposase
MGSKLEARSSKGEGRFSMRQVSKAASGQQLELDGIARFPLKRRGRGGRRAGAGRKRAPGVRESVPHRARPRHLGRHPVLVTLRAARGLPSLRAQRVSDMLREVLHGQRRGRRYSKVFQVVEFTIQDDHLHLIVEATGVVATGMVDAPDALRSGVSGLVIAFAKRLNKLLARRGKVWGDRFHTRELGSPTEVRNALVYVFRNVARHGAHLFGFGTVDQLSSAPRFTRWTAPVLDVKGDAALWPQAPPKTWLLDRGWWTRTRQGLLDPNEVRRRGE